MQQDSKMAATPPPLSLRRKSSRPLLSEGSTQNFLATPHAALSYAVAGNRSMYSLPQSRITHGEMEKLIFRRHRDGIPERIDFNDALSEIGCGGYQVLLVIICGLIFFTCSASITTLSFTLPASKCDLKLTSEDMGIINTSPLIGMVVGTFIWGPLSDKEGRHLTIILCLLVDFLATVASSFSINKWMLYAARFVNGFGIIGATSLIFAYMSEFLPLAIRDSLLFSLEIFYNLGVVYIPSISWLILPLNIDWNIYDTFNYHSWNLFTLATGIPGILSIILLSLFLPESPKYLLSQGKVTKMSKILEKMYKVNHSRKSIYPVTVNTEDTRFLTFFGTKYPADTGYLHSLFLQYKQLFGKNTRCRVIQFCLLNFFASFSYLALLIWLPELLERHDTYSLLESSRETLCYASDHLNSHAVHKESCRQKIEDNVYFEATIICATCIPATILFYFIMKFINKKVLTVFLMSSSGAATLSLAFAKGELVVAMCCLFEASSTVIETIVFVLVVESLPTAMSGTALALIATSGRMGAILGHILLGLVIDNYCNVSFYVMAGSFFSGAIVAITLPKVAEQDHLDIF